MADCTVAVAERVDEGARDAKTGADSTTRATHDVDGARDAPLDPAHRRVEVRAHGYGRAAFAGVRARGDHRDVQIDGVPAEGPAVRHSLAQRSGMAAR